VRATPFLGVRLVVSPGEVLRGMPGVVAPVGGWAPGALVFPLEPFRGARAVVCPVGGWAPGALAFLSEAVRAAVSRGEALTGVRGVVPPGRDCVPPFALAVGRADATAAAPPFSFWPAGLDLGFGFATLAFGFSAFGALPAFFTALPLAALAVSALGAAVLGAAALGTAVPAFGAAAGPPGAAVPLGRAAVLEPVGLAVGLAPVGPVAALLAVG
jgi:hypothetical protein